MGMSKIRKQQFFATNPNCLFCGGSKPHTLSMSGTRTVSHMLVGMLGGVIGGFTAFPGAALVVDAAVSCYTTSAHSHFEI